MLFSNRNEGQNKRNIRTSFVVNQNDLLKQGLRGFSSLALSQLQKSKEREERLEEVIQAYEKIHLEKSNVQRDLDKMVNMRTHTLYTLFHCNNNLSRIVKQQLRFQYSHTCVCVRRL